MGWGLGKVVADQVIAVQKYTQDWGTVGWTCAAIGVVVVALGGVKMLHWVSS